MKNSIKIKEIIIASLLVFGAVIDTNAQETTFSQPGTDSSSFGINYNNSNFQGILKLEGNQKGKYAGLFYNSDNGSLESGETRFGIGLTDNNNSWKEVFNIYPNGDLVVGGGSSVHNSSNGLPSLSVAGDVFSVSGSFISNSGFIGTNNGDIFCVNGKVGAPKISVGFAGEESLAHGQIQIDNKEINRKIILFENQDNDHEFSGFGINPNILRYQVGSTDFNHVFYAGNSANNSNELMRISGNGNVGIGTSNPQSKLAVNGNVRIEEAFSMGGEHEFSIDASGVVAGRLKVLRNGNVGIGTSNPQSKLAVNGAITALDYALVSAMAADYVFEPDYKLKTLTETEAYIKVNKHLPAFKSAKHYEANGYTMTEMNIALEQTVEEITLHSIAQEKEINHLKEEINLHNIAQEKETNSLKNELAEIKALLLTKK
jgi:hypothetical protein